MIVTQVGADLIGMAGTPNDYYVDVEGRNYDFGPGLGLRLRAAYKSHGWDIVQAIYVTDWVWTQSEPAESKHHLHVLWVDAQLPLTDYFAVGIGAGMYWRNSHYENFDDVSTKNPVGRLFFRTVL
jgi:hypothetical protein